MTLKLGVIMDPIEKIHAKKDTTLAMLLEAKRRGYELYYMQQTDLFVSQTKPQAITRPLIVYDNLTHWFELDKPSILPLNFFDVLLMRKDPPLDLNYIYTTQLLDLAEKENVLVVNRPQALRDFNEKLFTTWFPELCPETLVSAHYDQLLSFIKNHTDVILKPLHGMGGYAIFKVNQHDPNLKVIIEILSHKGQQLIMAQRYLPEIESGDKRVLLINGEPFPYALARHAQPGDTRANLAAGGTGKAIPISDNIRKMCGKVGPVLKNFGILFAGLDVIGDYITEINITSPTCIREIDQQCQTNVAAPLFNAIEHARK